MNYGLKYALRFADTNHHQTTVKTKVNGQNVIWPTANHHDFEI